MPLDQIANIAEIIAATLVIVSLIYVGYQIRETRVAVRAATAQARTDLGVRMIMSRYTSDIAELLTRSLEMGRNDVLGLIPLFLSPWIVSNPVGGTSCYAMRKILIQ